MLRLQPSEVGLTTADLKKYNDRLEFRRQARLQVINSQVAEAQQSHPQIQRGAQRHRDYALRKTPVPVALSYSVFDSSGETPVDEDVQTEVNCLLRESSVSQDENSLGAHMLAEVDTSTAAQSSRIVNTIHSNISAQHSSPHRKPHQRNNAARVEISQSSSDTSQFHEQESIIPQWDGANDDEPIPPQTSRRRYRPRSWSDPQEKTESQDLFYSRRRPVLDDTSLERLSLAHGPGISQVTHEQNARLFRQPGRVCLVNTKPLPSPFRTPLPAAYLALRDVPSPLEQLVSASKLLHHSRSSWHADLPFRGVDSTRAAVEFGVVPCGMKNLRTASRFLDAQDVQIDVETEAAPRPKDILFAPRFDGNSAELAPLEDHAISSVADSEPPSSPQRTGLVRRGAVHRHRTSIDMSISPDYNNPYDFSTSVAGSQLPSSPAEPVQQTSRVIHHPGMRQHLDDPFPDCEKSRFFRAISRANGGKLPHDAERRWMSVREQLASYHSDSSQVLPFESETDSQSTSVIALPASLPIRPRPEHFQLAIARGGRPLTDLSTTVPPQPIQRHRFTTSSGRRYSEQENIDEEAWERFETERLARLRRFEGGSRGDSGYRGDDEDDQDGTPPPTGRLEGLL